MMTNTYASFAQKTKEIKKFPTKEKLSDYLSLLDEIEFELAEMQAKVPVIKAVSELKIDDMVLELMDNKEEKVSKTKAESIAKTQLKDDILQAKEKEWEMAKLKTLVKIWDRTYYHCRKQLERAVETENKTKKFDELPF